MALSTNFNDKPEIASRPWDKDRDGFVMGEGSGVMVLEELEHAKKRNAKIYAEVIGYGMSGDAYHITSPSEDGDGGYRAMESAIRMAKISSNMSLCKKFPFFFTFKGLCNSRIAFFHEILLNFFLISSLSHSSKSGIFFNTSFII